MLLENPLDKSIEGIIHLDVQRSFQSSKIIKSESLINVLKVYAYSNEEVQYCQGMNFVAGFLLLITENESEAFKFMRVIIEKYQMQNLFIQDVPLLKEYFYELDRLVYLVMPDLSIFFKAEGVSTSFFASAWFMTVFTNSMQHVKDDKATEMILKIWDAFLIEGWKAVFKISLFIISELKEKLLDSKFDQIMALFGDVPRGKILHDPIFAQKLIQSYHNFKISNKLLSGLSEEYRESYKSLYEELGEEHNSPQNLSSSK